ncbi:MAG: DUF4129 domain-containing protein [Nocardioides sp.]
MTSRRASALAVGFSLTGVVLMLLLIVLAARSGPSGVFRGTPHDPVFHVAHPTALSSSASPVGHPPAMVLPRGRSSIPFSSVIGAVIRYALFAWLLVLAFRCLRWLVEEVTSRRRPEPPALSVDFDVLPDPTPLVEEMRRDADDQFELLLGGEPRNAIVACWDRFEEQAERVGVARRLWETSSEFTIRLLDAASADPTAVSRLAALYREARFSEHEITEQTRAGAVEALRMIHLSIGAGVGASP